MEFEFVIFWARGEQSNRSCHFQEAVANEFEPLVVLAHASLNVDLLGPVLFRVVRVLGDCFKSQFWLDRETQQVARLQRNQVGFDTADYSWKDVTHRYHTNWQLRRR